MRLPAIDLDNGLGVIHNDARGCRVIRQTNRLLAFLPGPVRGALSICLYALNSIFWCSVVFAVALLKLIIPIRSFRLVCGRLLNGIANSWIRINILNQQMTARTRWNVQGTDNLKPDAWYMVVANHQSWVDILVLQKIFFRKIPFLKFFLKKELIWIPFLGQAWWALDFPFMKRYSKGFLKRNPHLLGKDLEITRKACAKFKNIPVAIMNFVEGTRFTEQKHRQQRSPHAHLLRAKAGGMAFTLAAMGDQLHRLLDVTIVYPDGRPKFWDFVCGRVKEIRVRVRSLNIGDELRGDYTGDKTFHRNFQAWLNRVWADKDELIEVLQSPHPS
jgi:1-acyl-sn-glycerol-3-phosphate acyltransferase